MKAILEFDLPEDISELKQMMEANDYNLVLLDFNKWLRNEIKYNNKNELQPVRDKLYNFLSSHGIDLYDN